MSPQVTALMPAYERPKMMAEALLSALSQTYDALTILIGDNSDSDDIEHLVKSFDDPRVKYFRNSPAVSPQENWVNLANMAKTPYIASLHDDDVWEPDFLARTVQAMKENPGTKMVFTDYSIIDSDSTLLNAFTDKVYAWHYRDTLKEGPLNLDIEAGIRLAVVWNCPQPAYAALLDTKYVQSVDFLPEMAPLYDIWLSYQMAIDEQPMYYISDRLTRYRVHNQSLTSNSFALAEDRVFNHVINSHPDLDVALELEDRWADLRWGRATKLMFEEEGRSFSQEEFAQAVSGLHGRRKLAAWLGANSSLVWNGMRWIKQSKTVPVTTA